MSSLLLLAFLLSVSKVGGFKHPMFTKCECFLGMKNIVAIAFSRLSVTRIIHACKFEIGTSYNTRGMNLLPLHKFNT